MRKLMLIFGAMVAWHISGANAQVELKTYADLDGFLNVQALTCA